MDEEDRLYYIKRLGDINSELPELRKEISDECNR